MLSSASVNHVRYLKKIFVLSTNGMCFTDIQQQKTSKAKQPTTGICYIFKPEFEMDNVAIRENTDEV
jgi:hypothetical protein